LKIPAYMLPEWSLPRAHFK